ncbi:MAG: hypothetical protein Q8R57_04730 [Bacteroidota bacterium]|jgi:hypothetical protein|nr:hypothetical protein [Bacteroidota bacterium]
MNPILFTVLKSIINLAGVVAGFFLYKIFVRPITIQTIAPDNFQEIVAVLCLLILWPVLSMKQLRPFNYYSLAIVSLLIPALLFGIFAINQHSSAPSYTRLFPIERTVVEGDALKLTAYIYEKKSWNNYTVPNNDCLQLDSVQIRVIDGHLGMKVLTDELVFSQKPGCQ